MATELKTATALEAKAKPAKATDSERIDAVIALLRANGMSIPKGLE